MSEPASHECSGHTHIGKVRAENQDCFAINSEYNIYIVADGMGGHENGAVASKLAVTLAEAEMIKLLQRYKYLADDPDGLNARISEVFDNVNRHIFLRNKGKRGLSVMGTTLSAVTLVGHRMLYSNVGDSRIYLFDGTRGQLKRVSRDDTVAEDMVSKGINTIELRESYYQNQLTQAIGTKTYISPNTGYIGLHPDDIILICSDGLYNMIGQDELDQMFKTCEADNAGMNDLVDGLIQKANDNGGFDNITAIAIRV